MSLLADLSAFFTEHRQLTWVLLVVTLLWGIYGYRTMPKRKDPQFQLQTAVAICPWPGASAEKIEQQVVRKIEEKLASNARVEKLDAVARNGLALMNRIMASLVRKSSKKKPNE